MPDEVRADTDDLIHAAEGFRDNMWYYHSETTISTGYMDVPWLSMSDPRYSLGEARETVDALVDAMDLLGKAFRQTSIALYHTAFAYHEADLQAAAGYTPPEDGPR